MRNDGKHRQKRSLSWVAISGGGVIMFLKTDAHNALLRSIKEDTTMENENWGEDILTLMDEDGVESEYRIVACAEVDGVEYMALEPINEDPEQALMEAAELVFLKVSEELDEDGEAYLDTIQDDEEFERVAEIFRDKLSEEYDFLEGDEEE